MDDIRTKPLSSTSAAFTRAKLAPTRQLSLHWLSSCDSKHRGIIRAYLWRWADGWWHHGIAAMCVILALLRHNLPVVLQQERLEVGIVIIITGTYGWLLRISDVNETVWTHMISNYAYRSLLGRHGAPLLLCLESLGSSSTRGH